jgi:hypothetical protein
MTLCWNWSDLQESGGVPGARLVVWADRLEMSGRGPFKAVFRTRAIQKERVLLARPLLLLHPALQFAEAVHSLPRERELVNLVVSQPKEQRDNTGNIHYLLGLRSPAAADVLDVLDAAGYPVRRTVLRMTKLNVGGELSWLDLKEKRGLR